LTVDVAPERETPLLVEIRRMAAGIPTSRKMA
jgi:hypothetical protein